jgi:probable HAF family extracellular repeat protein
MRVFAAAMLLPVCLLTATPIYVVVDLGSVGNGSISAATALNSSGSAVGWSVASTQSIYAFRSSGGGVAEALGSSSQGRAQGINDSGEIVGARYDAYGNAEAVKWSADGSAVSVLGGGVNSYAMAINGSGAVVGAANGRAVRFTESGPVDIAVSGTWSTASAVNERGAVAGTTQSRYGQFRAFTAGPEGGPATLIGSLGGGASYGQAINSTGWVAGGSTTAYGYLHAFLYARGKLQDLGTLDRGNNSSAYGVNDVGQVVGYSQDAAGDSRAFLFENGRMKDLNQLIAADMGWRLSEASAINNNGQIVGFGMKDGVRHAFRLDPIATAFASSARVALVQDIAAPTTASLAVPEPSALLLFAAGAAGIAVGSIHRRRHNKKKQPLASYYDFCG